MPLDDLGADVFAELGRVTWAAIHLEDYTGHMCSTIQPSNPRADRRIIGQRIKDAQRVLAGWSATPTRDTAVTWLIRARDALDRRNATLHAVPLTSFQPGQPPQPMLGEMPRGSRPYIESPLTVASLAELQRVLTAPLNDWRDVLLAVAAEAERQRDRSVR